MKSKGKPKKMQLPKGKGKGEQKVPRYAMSGPGLRMEGKTKGKTKGKGYIR